MSRSFLGGEGYVLYEDALEALARLQDGAARLLILDPPYGTTELPWDQAPSLTPLLLEARRVLGNGVALAFAAHPFALDLLNAARGVGASYYELIWVKRRPTNPLNASRMPLRGHENVFVLYWGPHIYVPQLRPGAPYRVRRRVTHGSHWGGPGEEHVAENPGTRHPTTVWHGDVGDAGERRIHPTQKPLAFLIWAVRSYTHPGDLVVDPYAGSGVSGVAALMEGRRWVGAEANPEYRARALEWLSSVQAPLLREE